MVAASTTSTVPDLAVRSQDATWHRARWETLPADGNRDEIIDNRTDDLGAAPLGIAFTPAGNEPRDCTPPHTIYHPEYFGHAP